MKTTFKLFLFVQALILTFPSCKKDDNSLNLNNSGSESITVSGTIVNYIIGEVNFVKSHQSDYSENEALSSSAISSDGEFSIVLSGNKLILKKASETAPQGVELSDETASIGSSQLAVYKDVDELSELIKCNYTNPNNENVGMAYSSFIYSDKPLTIKGVETNGSSDDIYIYNYNCVLKKGWNEIISKITTYTKTTNGYIETSSVTTEMPSDLNWRYFTYGSSEIRNKVQSLKKLHLKRLFILNF